MTQSMTGYGKQTASYKGRLLTVEVKTLNSKQADLNLRIPSIYREREFEIRDLLSQKLVRGKIDLNIQRDLADGEATTTLNEALVKKHCETIQRLNDELGAAGSHSTLELMGMAMKMPDVFQPTSEELDTAEFEALMKALDDAINLCLEFRQQEGAKLEAVLAESESKITEYLTLVEPLEAERTERIRGRITASLSSDTADSLGFDRDRFEQELIYYLEKLDISEEKVRLKAHCEYFIKTLKEEPYKGKKLSFISQEMGREINTLGSKAQHSDIQRIVVGMKDELEKIKEQVLNVL